MPYMEQLKLLLEASGPSGYEEQIIDLFRSFIAPYVDEVSVDVNGNCIAHKKGTGKKVMLVAHADEVGLMVSYIDDKGYVYFKEIGGIDTNLLPGQRVSIAGRNGTVVGIVGKKPIHLQEKADGCKELNPEDLWIDIGAKNKEEAERCVCIGDCIVYNTEPISMANALVAAKSLDDRAGLAVLLGVAQEVATIDADIYFVASVQEELGARGIQSIVGKIAPDVGIAVDVTHATDYPSMSVVKDGDIKLGEGAVIAVGPNMHKGVSNKLLDIASANHLKSQIEAISRPTGTDAREIQVSEAGVMTGLISIPCRYMHTPNEIISLNDIKAAVSLLSIYVQQL